MVLLVLSVSLLLINKSNHELKEDLNELCRQYSEQNKTNIVIMGGEVYYHIGNTSINYDRLVASCLERGY